MKRKHDPKIVPPPDEFTWTEVELSKEERDGLEEVAKGDGCWSADEFLRSFTADFLATRKTKKRGGALRQIVDFLSS